MKQNALFPRLVLPLGAALALNFGLMIRQLFAKWGNGDLEALYYKVMDGYLVVGLPLSLLFVGTVGAVAFHIQRRADRQGAMFQFAILAGLYVFLGLMLALGVRFPVTKDWLLVVIPLLVGLGLAHGLLAFLGARIFARR